MATYLFDSNKYLVDTDEVSPDILYNMHGIYGIDEYKNFIEIKINVGETKILDGIECLCICNDPYIFVDKNHDLSYYISGSDFYNTAESYSRINTAATYGYEWGGFETETGVTATAIGTGLANTNALIGMNLQPNSSNWGLLWDKVQEFRTNRSNKWFVPSRDELNLVYQQKANLTNITDDEIAAKTTDLYWSSSEYSDRYSYFQKFKNGNQATFAKNYAIFRTRLCRTL